ncbi:MAG: homoserine kinase [Myxococcota bacterium]
MAVYTHLTRTQISRYARWFGLSEPTAVKGIAAGTINTIYALQCAEGRFILRLLENRSRTDARFEEALLLHLERAGLSVPSMLQSPRHGGVVTLSSRQHLSIFRWMPGRETAVFELEPHHAGQVGVFLGRMHAATQSFRRRRRNRFAPEYVDRFLSASERFVDGHSDQGMRRHIRSLRSELTRFQWPTRVPVGVIHADLFVDNAFFRRGKLSGVLDFEMACTSPLIYDVAASLMDWAFEKDRFVRPRARALLAGYQSERVFAAAEKRQLFAMCRYIATRYATSRFYDFEVSAHPDAERAYKDYRHYMLRLGALKSVGARGLRELVDSTAHH